MGSSMVSELRKSIPMARPHLSTMFMSPQGTSWQTLFACKKHVCPPVTQHTYERNYGICRSFFAKTNGFHSNVSLLQGKFSFESLLATSRRRKKIPSHSMKEEPQGAFSSASLESKFVNFWGINHRWHLQPQSVQVLLKPIGGLVLLLIVNIYIYIYIILFNLIFDRRELFDLFLSRHQLWCGIESQGSWQLADDRTCNHVDFRPRKAGHKQQTLASVDVGGILGGSQLLTG